MIRELKDSEVPNSRAVRHWSCVFYESTETRGDQLDQTEGGVIPGLHEYRYSLDWEPTPESELIEMRHANGGGTRLKGEYHVGTSDPRLSDYVPIDMTVGWTPGEIKKMYDGEDVPNKVDYSHDPPMMEASEARDKFRRLVQNYAHEVGFEKLREALHEHMENCDHDHVVKDEAKYRPEGYCEDCGKEWVEPQTLNESIEAGEATVVGTTA
jgi:hypothetical protein